MANTTISYAVVPTRWDVAQRVGVYAALLVFCVLCWWGVFALMARIFGR